MKHNARKNEVFCDKIRDEITVNHQSNMLVETSRLKGLQKDWRQKMQKKRIQKRFLNCCGSLLVEFLLYFLLTNKWLLLAVIIALDIFSL